MDRAYITYFLIFLMVVLVITIVTSFRIDARDDARGRQRRRDEQLRRELRIQRDRPIYTVGAERRNSEPGMWTESRRLPNCSVAMRLDGEE